MQNIVVSIGFVVAEQMVFCEIVCLVGSLFLTFYFELLLSLAISKQVVFHIPALGSFFTHC